MAVEARLHRARGMLTTLTNGRHAWTADVGKASGSDDAAPDPHDLLASALAACTALTLELYVRRKGYTIDALRVVVAHEETTGAAGEPRTVLTRTVHVDGELPADVHAKLLAIAGKCPIHRVLENDVEIRTTLAAEAR